MIMSGKDYTWGKQLEYMQDVFCGKIKPLPEDVDWMLIEWHIAESNFKYYLNECRQLQSEVATLKEQVEKHHKSCQ